MPQILLLGVVLYLVAIHAVLVTQVITETIYYQKEDLAPNLGLADKAVSSCPQSMG